MTRGQRRLHRAIWPVLMALLVLGAGMAVALRPPADPPAGPPPGPPAKEAGR